MIMSFKEAAAQDIDAVFMNVDEFADVHEWEGKSIICLIDVDTELKRKNNNVLDISWDNNRDEIHVFVSKTQLEHKPIINNDILLDGDSYRVMSVEEDMGMYVISLTAQTARWV